MKLWRWGKRHAQSEDNAEAQVSKHQAARSLLDAKNLASRVEKVAGDLAATNERNHFGDAVARSMRRQ